MDGSGAKRCTERFRSQATSRCAQCLVDEHFGRCISEGFCAMLETERLGRGAERFLRQRSMPGSAVVTGPEGRRRDVQTVSVHETSTVEQMEVFR